MLKTVVWSYNLSHTALRFGAKGSIVSAMKKSKSGILVVDDDKDQADTMVEILERIGYPAVAVYGGRQALEELDRGSFQLLITDVVMPEMNGIELLKKIHRINSKFSIIVLTGHASIETAVAAIKGGAYDYIEKPYDIKALELIIDRALERYGIFSKLNRARTLFLFLLISTPLWIIVGFAIISSIFGE